MHLGDRCEMKPGTMLFNKDVYMMMCPCTEGLKCVAKDGLIGVSIIIFTLHFFIHLLLRQFTYSVHCYTYYNIGVIWLCLEIFDERKQQWNFDIIK